MKCFIEKTDLSYFLFPSYRKVDSLDGFGRGKVLYVLQKNDKIIDIDKKMSFLFSDYVIVTSNEYAMVDVKFVEQKDFLDFVSRARGLKLTKNIEKNIKFVSDEEFLYFIKMSLVLGRWYYELFEKHEKVYQLFEALKKSKEDLMGAYFGLRGRLSPEEIFSSVLTFLYKLKSKELRKDKGVSDYYVQLLGAVENIVKVESLPSLLTNMIRIKNEVPFENRVLYFLLSLRK